MIIVWALSWWYGVGWKAEAVRLRERLASTYDYFSIGLLITTLFSPYKQISAGQVNGPIGVKFRAFFDRLISRIVGGFIRSIVVFIGCVWMLTLATLGAIGLATWAILPAAPFVGFVLMIAGLVPSWM